MGHIFLLFFPASSIPSLSSLSGKATFEKPRSTLKNRTLMHTQNHFLIFSCCWRPFLMQPFQNSGKVTVIVWCQREMNICVMGMRGRKLCFYFFYVLYCQCLVPLTLAETDRLVQILHSWIYQIHMYTYPLSHLYTCTYTCLHKHIHQLTYTWCILPLF